MPFNREEILGFSVLTCVEKQVAHFAQQKHDYKKQPKRQKWFLSTQSCSFIWKEQQHESFVLRFSRYQLCCEVIH